MNNTRITSIATACLLSAGLAFAQDKKEAAPPPMAMPKPAPELEASFKDYLGNWKCETTMPAGSMGPGSPEMKVPSTVKIKKDPGGFWYDGTWETKKTKTMPGMKGEFTIGHTGKEAILVGRDSMGGASMASGTPQGDTTVFTGEGFLMGQKAKVRETMTKKGPKEISHKWETDMGKGWQTMAEDSCKK